MFFPGLSETFFILRRIQRDVVINVRMFSCKVRGTLFRILTKIEFSRQIFEKHSNVKFHENPSIGIRDFSCGRTDRRTDMTKLIVSFRNFANALKMICGFGIWFSSDVYNLN
jgi:hypothetical protein